MGYNDYGKMNRKGNPHRILLIQDKKPTYEFYGYPNHNKGTFKLYAADITTRREYPNPHVVSMQLVQRKVFTTGEAQEERQARGGEV